MIKETNNIDLINSFLINFDVVYSDNPFRKYLVFDDIAILVYSKIYERIEIDYIFTKNEYRNNNIAFKLISYLIENNNFEISLEVRCDNIAAINLYKKLNFEIVCIRNKYYNDIDGYLMIRKC